jgi:hypothetical protein
VPPATFEPPDPLAQDEFASPWEGERGEITAPITTTSDHPLVLPDESEEKPQREILVPAASLSPTAPVEDAPRPPQDQDPFSGAPFSPPSQFHDPFSGASQAPPPQDPFSTALAGTLGLDAGPSRCERTTLSEYAPSPWDQGPARTPAVVLDDGVGLDLAMVAEHSGLHPLVPEAIGQAPPAAARSEVEIWMDGARELFALGDFSGSLEMIEKILKMDPSHAEAREYLKQNEATLIAMYESKLGPGDAVPRLAIQPEEVMWLNLDHRAGFLLAQIDGLVSYEDLFALSGLPRLDTARILAALLQEGVIRS